MTRSATSIVIGMGTGRSGTRSLAELVNLQEGAVCFHEVNPSCMTWDSSPVTVRSMIREFRDVLEGRTTQTTVDHSTVGPVRRRFLDSIEPMENVRVIGDVSFYYLSYVPLLARLDDRIRMPCMRRERKATVESFLRKARIDRTPRMVVADRLNAMIKGWPYHRTYNYWVDHDGSKWKPHPIWDSCFPSFEADTVQAAVERYWNHYYEQAANFQRRYPGVFQIFDIECLNSPDGQRKIMRFCGIHQPTTMDRVHENRGG